MAREPRGVTCRECGCLNFSLEHEVCDKCRLKSLSFRPTARKLAANGARREEASRTPSIGMKRSHEPDSKGNKAPNKPKSAPKKQPDVIDLVSDDDEDEDVVVQQVITQSLETFKEQVQQTGLFQSRVFPTVTFVASDFPTMEESTQMRKSAVEMSHSQPTRGRNTGINGAAKPSTSATQPAARTKEKVELKQGDGAPAVEVVEKKVVVTPEKKKKEAEEKQAQKENETVASSTAGKIAKQSEKVVAEVRKEEKVDPFFQSREFDAIEFKASDFPSVSDGLAVARRSHPPAPSTNPAPLGQSTTVPTASKPNDVPGSAKVPTVAPVTASVVPSSTTTKATPAAKTTAVTVASKVSTTTAIAAPPSMGKTKSALKAPTESVLKATPQSNTPKPPAATPATKTPATPSKTAVATPSTKVPATQSTTAAVPRTTQAVPIPRQSRLAPRTRISPGPPPAAPVPLPSKPVTPTPSTMKPRSRTETATTPPPASKPTARVPVAATSAATKPSTAPAPGQNQANGNANVLLPKKRRSEEVPRADEAKRQAKAPLTTVKAPADGEGVEFVKVNAAPRAIPPVEPPVLGYCTPDFLAFMRECGDEDGDEEDDPEEESRSQLKLLDVVDLTNLSDSEDSETESPMPTPRGVPLQSLPATGQAAAVNEPTATANVNVSGTGTWYVPTLDSERKRTRPEKVMCELCEEKGSPSRLIHCSTCTKYYHKKCAKENGDENICWNCELGSMIDDSELDEEHARHSSDYLAYLKAIRRSSSPESEENEEEASGENEEQEGEEVEDGDVEMPNADAGEEDNNPFSEENNAKKAGKSWMEFVGDVTGDVDAGFQEVTNRIAEELRDEEKRRLYSRGFVSRAEFEAQMTEVEEYYISEEARLQQLEREKAIEAKKAAEARKAQAEAEEKTSSDQPGSSATSVPSIPASVAQGDATGSAGGAVSSALPSSTSATPVALSDERMQEWQTKEADEEMEQSTDSDYNSLWDVVDAPEALRSPRDNDVRSIIDVLSSQLQNREIPQYLDEFEVVIPDAEVVVGSVPIEEVQEREQQIEEAKLRQVELESALYRQREIHLAKQEAIARERLLQEARRRHAELVLKDRQAAEAMQWRARRIGHVFQQAETHLKDTLKKQEARVEQLYGFLMPSRVPESRKRYRVEWARIPLTIRIRGRMLNAVKDKLPPGQYVMVATLYDRLGGHALHWTNWDPEVAPNASSAGANEPQVRRPNFTRPFHHRGRFYNTGVIVNHDMFVVCPPEVELRPGNTLVFELFLLSQSTASAYAGNTLTMPRRRRRGGQVLNQTMAMQTDHVVAWGAIPLTTPEFQVVQGKLKLPLLRGEMDHTMDKYQDIEKMYQTDLSSWLCNFYFQVYHLPKPPATLLHRSPRNRPGGEDPYDAEIDERGGLVRLMLPEVENNHQRYMRKMSTATPQSSTVRKRSLPTRNGALEEMYSAVVKPYSSASTVSVDEDAAYPKKKKTKPPRILSPTRWRWKRWLAAFNPTKKTRIYSGDVIAMQNRNPSRKTIPIESESQDDEREPMLKDQASSRHLGLDGLQLDSNEDLDEDTTVKRHQDLDVENYTYSVNAAASMETARHQRFHAQRKMHYLRHELLVDLGFSNWHTLEFWRQIAMLLFACWIRLYVHYMTQWLFLRGNRVPVYDFQPRWTTCTVKYTWQTVATHTEIGLLSLGVLGNTMMFGFLSGAAALGQRYVGDLPAFGSNFVACAGIATVLDPFLVLLVDILSHHYGCSQLSECAVSLTASGCSCVNGDWFKLYVRFQAQEGSGLVGIFIVLILYVALTCMSLVALYVYLLYIHMNGRMLDVYRRVHGHEDAFFVPHDAEISLQELQTVCAQATRWKGPRGTQRKVFVHEYALSDPPEPLFRETNTHIAVYNVELDGARELHRHFLKMPDGAVLELFGELGANTDGNWTSDAPQGAASLALLYNILQDVQREDNSTAMTSAGLFDGM